MLNGDFLHPAQVFLVIDVLVNVDEAFIDLNWFAMDIRHGGVLESGRGNFKFKPCSLTKILKTVFVLVGQSANRVAGVIKAYRASGCDTIRLGGSPRIAGW